MASARPFHILSCALLFALLTVSGQALQIGESAAQITARHGAAAVEDHGRHLAMYFWEGWSAQLEFQKGVVGKLTYRRNGSLTDAEVQSLFQANGGAGRWRETTSLGTKARRWVRDDGAVATSDAARPTIMIFQTTGTATEALSPVEAIVAESFLKFDAPANPPAPQPTPTAAGNEPIVRSNAPQPQLRSEPELRVDDVKVAPAPLPAESPEVAIVESEAPAEIPPAPIAETVSIQAPAPATENHRLIYSLVLGFGLVGTALLFLLPKRQKVRTASSVRPAAPRAAAPAPRAPAAAAGDAADLDALRGDQIELLLGEIFRRQGFTVELSAALGADGASDLMLRRDGESIPVQSKEWKTARVSERELREFYGVMTATAAPRGVFVTTGGFTSDAREFAAGKSIELIDRRGLEQRIVAILRPEENFFDVPCWIDDFTAHARIFDPECPCCSQAMVIRHNRSDGSASWGCTSYPRCSGRRETRRDLLTLPAAA